MVSQKSASPTDTAERLLDAAESLFGTHGIDGTSIREIAKAARANLAAAHYHFGSKESLYEATFLRRLRPLNATRLAQLDQALQTSHDQRLAAVLSSFIAPTLAMGRQYPSFLALLGRNLTTPPPFMAEMMRRELAPLVERYRPALQELLPHLPPVEVFWRMQFIVGSLLFTTAHFPTIERLSPGLASHEASETMSRRLVAFATAGLQAPTPS